MTEQYTLTELGWKAYFQQQLTLDECEASLPARVFALDRSIIHLQATSEKIDSPLLPSMKGITVGDWVLLDEQKLYSRTLERTTLFSRKSAGKKVDTQLIAANLDTVFIVSAMNMDFNLNRIERYLVLANEAGVQPVLVLTRLDSCTEPDTYRAQAQGLDSSIEVVLVNSLYAESVSQLNAWCSTGQTVALLGSSGVGKSTIVNTLLGKNVQDTHSIREDDSKGRHTTTGRSIHLLTEGGLLLDTPGMRELQLLSSEHGVDETFSEITKFAAQCKFSDCQHEYEPGCAVIKAIEEGRLEERRLASYKKLIREQAFNAATLAEKRAKDRQFGRHVRSVMHSKKQKYKE